MTNLHLLFYIVLIECCLFSVFGEVETISHHEVCMGSDFVFNNSEIDTITKVNDWDNEVIVGDGNILNPNVIFNSEKEIVIKNLKLKDTGKYICECNGAAKTLMLHVVDTRYELVDTVNTINAEEHERVVLKIRTFSSLGKISWKLQNRVLYRTNDSLHFHFPNPESYGISIGSVLEIRSIAKRHAGTYKFTQDIDGCTNHTKIRVHIKQNHPVISGFIDPFVASFIFMTKRLLPSLKTKSAFWVLMFVLVVITSLASCVAIVCILDIVQKCRKKCSGRKRYVSLVNDEIITTKRERALTNLRKLQRLIFEKMKRRISKDSNSYVSRMNDLISETLTEQYEKTKWNREMSEGNKNPQSCSNLLSIPDDADPENAFENMSDCTAENRDILEDKEDYEKDVNHCKVDENEIKVVVTDENANQITDCKDKVLPSTRSSSSNTLELNN